MSDSMDLIIRTYSSDDYDPLVEIYRQSDLYGGQFDEARDSRDRLNARARQDPDSILIAERDGQIVGTVSLIEDARVAWLFRFAVIKNEHSKLIRNALYAQASATLKNRGHSEVLVYAPPDQDFEENYRTLGFNKGGTYTCFWRSLSA